MTARWSPWSDDSRPARTGRWLGEQKCGHKLVTGDQEWPNAFWVAYDPAAAAKPPAVLAVDAALLAQKLRAVKLGTRH